MKKIKVASVQFNSQANNKSYNLSRIEFFVEKAAKEKVKIICFPEMCITGYWHVRNMTKDEIDSLSEEIPTGESTKKLLELSKKHNLIIGAGLIEKSNNKYFNSYVITTPDAQAKVHRKIHAFENNNISFGNEFTVFKTPLGIKLGVLICYDNNIIENVRITALNGADILLAPHQSGGTKSRSPYTLGLIDPTLWMNRKKNPELLRKEIQGPKGKGWFMRWLPSRAHDNGMFIIFSNGIGFDDGEVRTGHAMIIDPYGRIIKESKEIDDDIVIANLDLDLLDMCTGRRWIRGRRPELYSKLVEKTGKELDPREAKYSAKKT